MDKVFMLLLIFSFGSVFGWIIELIFRRIINKNKKWVNPGFLVGPYLPIYGFGILILFLIASLADRIFIPSVILKNIVLLLLMGAAMTLLEYIAGVIFIKKMKVKLWDYSGSWGNFRGIICPLYSFFWMLLGALYYYTLHPYINNLVRFAYENKAIYFSVGMFYGFFIVDLVYSAQILVKIKRFADENKMVVKLEALKENIIRSAEERKKRVKFFLILSSENSIFSHLKSYKESAERIRTEIRNKIKKNK